MQIELGKELIDYEIRESKRAKRLSIVVHWDGRCEVVIPHKKRWNEKTVEKLFRDHKDWVLRSVRSQKQNKDRIPLQHQGIPRTHVQNQTVQLVESMVQDYCRMHGFFVRSVKVRSYKTRWGSCAIGFRLGFHYKLSLLPTHLAEYVIIHELCHTVHFNHSKAFWAEVEKYCPDYKQCRKELKNYLI